MSKVEIPESVFDDGPMSFTEANDANIPVHIFLGEDSERPGHFEASASNYMPRKGYVSEVAYEAKSRDKDALVAYVQACVRPLYVNALACIDALGEFGEYGSSLYYWNAPEKPKATGSTDPQ